MEKKNNGLLIVIIVILALSTLGLGGFIIYDKLIKEDKVVDSDSDTTKEIEDTKKLELDDSLVKKYYAIINNEDDYIYAVFSEGKKKLLTKNIEPEEKNRWAMHLLETKDIKTGKCADYKDLFDDHNKDADIIYYCDDDNFMDGICGGEEYIGTSTDVFKEDTLKAKVNELFGPNAYQEIEDFNDSYSVYLGGYLYNNKTKEYVNYLICSGGLQDQIERKLLEASTTEDKLFIKEEFKAFDVSTKKEFKKNLIYTFNKTDDNSYYLYSIEVEK